MHISKSLGAVALAAVVVLGSAFLIWQTEQAPAAQSDGKKIVLIGGPGSHGPAEHDIPEGIQVLQAILESSPDLKALNVRIQAFPDGWPADDSVLDDASTIVWYFDGLEKHPLTDAARRERFGRLMNRGVGLVTLHQAVTLLRDDTSIPLADWVGGARYGMFDRTYESVGFVPADHPVSTGVGPFTLRDEFYPTIQFPSTNQVTPILSGTFHVAMEDGQPAPERDIERSAAWAFERPNGGRAFAYTGLHYLLSLDHPQLRRLLLNAIVWTAGLEVPSTGVRSGVPDAATKVAASVGVHPEPAPPPRAPQTAVTEAVVLRAADREVEQHPWGTLSFFVNRALKNSDTMTVLQAVIRPGQQNGRHYHPNCDEVIVLVQGHVINTMNGVEVEMRAGDVVSIPRGAVHNTRNIGTEDAILIVSYDSADRVAVGE